MAEEKPAAAASVVAIGRSANYPYIAVTAAAKQAKKLFAGVGKNWATIPTAGKIWGYAEKSSGLRSTVSTLKQYGLLQDTGEGDKRQVKLTERGLDLAVEREESPKYRAALMAAATAPKIYTEILAAFTEGLPSSDHAIESYLLREKEFNPKAVPGFIVDFRTNMQIANVGSSANIPLSKDIKADPPEIAVGDLIQWESSGVVRLESPKRVRAIREHEGAKWIFIEGSETGIPMTEAILEQRGGASTTGNAPPMLAEERPGKLVATEKEWLRGPLSKEASYRLIVTGDIGPREIGKLIKLLEAQKAVLDEDDD